MSPRGRRFTPTTAEDVALRPLYKQHGATGSPPDRVLLALLTRGITGGIPPHRVRGWARHTGDPDLCAATDSARGWSRVVRAAREHVKNSKTTPNRTALTERYVRAWVVHLLTNPVVDRPPHPRAVLGARHLHLRLSHTIATHTSTTGWDTHLTWRAALTVPLGVGRDAVSGRVKTAREVGWVRVVRERGDGGLIVKPGPVRAAQRGGLPTDAVDAVVVDVCRVLLADDPVERDAAREGLGPAARVLLSADHPAWVHDDRLSLTTLIVMLADTVGIDPAGLDGISKASVRSSRQLAEERLGWDESGDGLETALNARGTAGAFEAHKHALAVREEEKAATAQARVEDQQIRDAVSYALDEAGSVPGPDDDRADADAWAGSMADAVIRMDLDKRGQGTVRRDLTRRLNRAGWTTGTAKAIAARIAPPPTEVPGAG